MPPDGRQRGRDDGLVECSQKHRQHQADKNGVVHDVREFNTQTCEQLNAWLGGFESILKRMTSKNFNWFLHVMLFYHVQHILEKSSVPPVAGNQDDDHRDSKFSDEENDNDSDSEEEKSGSDSDRDSSESSEESTSSSSGIDNLDLNSDNFDEESDDKDTTTDSDDEVPIGDTNDDMVQEDEEEDEDSEEEDEEDDEEDEDKMEVDDD